MPSDAWKAAEIRRREERFAAGLCTKCGKEPLVPGKRQGRVCLDKHAAWMKANIRNSTRSKTCPQCHKPAVKNRVHCADCAERMRNYYHDRKLKKLCLNCGKEPTPGTNSCDTCRAQKRATCKVRRDVLRLKVLAEYGGKCACCGEATPEFLHVDHVNNDGAEHRRTMGKSAGNGFYLWLKRNRFPKEGFQLLCANCNWAKFRYKGCPHQRPKPNP